MLGEGDAVGGEEFLGVDGLVEGHEVVLEVATSWRSPPVTTRSGERARSDRRVRRNAGRPPGFHRVSAIVRGAGERDRGPGHGRQ